MLSAPQKKPAGATPPLVHTQSLRFLSQWVPVTPLQSSSPFFGSQSGARVDASTQVDPVPQDVSFGPLHDLRAPMSRPSWPSGQLTRPWKWFTRQMRLAHWKERDSMFSSVTLKPAKSELYSSSGVHGS